VTYCGGRIASTLGAPAFAVIGYQNSLEYDGSLAEWIDDGGHPMATGEGQRFMAGSLLGHSVNLRRSKSVRRHAMPILGWIGSDGLHAEIRIAERIRQQPNPATPKRDA
jgi:hypothetical protein